MDININTVNNINQNQINPECLGSVLINGVYHDKKTAKFLSLKGLLNNNSNKNEDISDSFYTKFMNLFKSK